MAIPSLAMIPSGYKDGKVYSVLPSNGDGDFTFSRGSNATRVNKDGLIETVTGDTPRLDYSDGSCPSLLLEPQRTNLIPQSETFLAGWSKINGVVVSDEKEISPDGTLNASKLVFDGTNNGRIERGISGLTQGADYTVSVYARVASGTQEVSFGSFEEAPFTLTTEWQRLTRTQAENDTVAYPRLRCNDAATIEIYGFQLEQGSYATSYIPTQGSAVTRLADECNNGANEQVINSTEGVLYAEIAALADDGSYKTLTINNNGVSDRIQISINSNNVFIGVIDGDSAEIFQSYSVSNITNNNKIAVKYKLNDCSLWINGIAVLDNLAASMPSGLSKISFDKGNGADDFYGNIKQIQYFNTALTDLELQQLTTI